MRLTICLTLVLASALSPLPAKAGEKVHTVPLAVEGSLPDGDNKVKVEPPDPKFKSIELPAKLYEVKLPAGKSYTITMTSSEFDSFLVVQDGAGKQLAFDDDGGGDLNSKIQFAPAKDGTFKVYAAALNGQGKYSLKIAAQDIKVLDAAAGVKVEGELKKDEASITYHVKLAQGKTYVIDMMVAADSKLDPFLKLIDPSGKEIAKDDDGGDNLNARITVQATESGTYQIVATSFLNSTIGRYILSVQAK